MAVYTQHKTRLAIFDVCHTLVDVTTITDFVDTMLVSRSQNKRWRLSGWAWHAVVKFARYRLGLVDSDTYRTHLVSLFRGYQQEEIKALAAVYSDRLHMRLKPETYDRLKALRNEGYVVCLVSAGLNVYLDSFAKSLGVECISTTVGLSDGRYTGKIEGVDCVGEGKVIKLQEHFPDADTIDWGASYSFGDRESDVPILALVGNSVAVDPDILLRARATKDNWEVLQTATK